jgi:hypothetical protein
MILAGNTPLVALALLAVMRPMAALVLAMLVVSALLAALERRSRRAIARAAG